MFERKQAIEAVEVNQKTVNYNTGTFRSWLISMKEEHDRSRKYSGFTVKEHPFYITICYNPGVTVRQGVFCCIVEKNIDPMEFKDNLNVSLSRLLDVRENTPKTDLNARTEQNGGKTGVQSGSQFKSLTGLLNAFSKS